MFETFCCRSWRFFQFSFMITAVGNAALFAQRTAGNRVDLTAPALQAHAHLPQHNPPGMPIQQKLAEARVLAASKGFPWKGLNTFVIDESGGVGNETLLKTYQQYTCLAEVIAVGHTTSWTHHLSASGTAVYGDYVFVIDTLLKDNRRSSIQSTPEIVVTRPGGTLTLLEGSVTFEHQAFPLLQLGSTYLMFLRYIPESGGYEALDSLATLVATDSNWVIAQKALSRRVLPGFTRDALEASIRMWLTSCK